MIWDDFHWIRLVYELDCEVPSPLYSVQENFEIKKLKYISDKTEEKKSIDDFMLKRNDIGDFMLKRNGSYFAIILCETI